jgi:hypothetical protein
MPTFSTWERATLDRFAAEAYAKLQQQDDQIQHLQADLKDAIAAYRELMKQQENT